MDVADILMTKKQQAYLDKAVEMLFKMKGTIKPESKKHIPTTSELNEKFVLREDRDGNPVMLKVD